METLKPYPLLAVRAIIKNEADEILLLKRASKDAYGDMWCLPGGKVDFGQTAEEAIIREIQEETSLICSSSEFLFYKDGIPQNPGENHYLTLYFYCQANGTIELNRESSRFAWLGLEELGKYDIAFNNDDAIKSFWEDHL
jgi:8-oxo-dGTP diphosphatase